jgi:hypothetical protein
MGNPCPECGHGVSKRANTCPTCGYAVANHARRRAAKVASAMLVAAFAAVAFLSMQGGRERPVPAAKVPLIGETWYIKGEPIGCHSSTDLDRLSSLPAQPDADAFIRFYAQQTAGDCRKLPDGTQVFVEKAPPFTSPCVRPKGDPFCLYVMPSYLKSDRTLTVDNRQ